MPKATRRFVVALVLICAAGLVLRLVFVLAWYSHMKLGGDAFHYYWQARLADEGKGFLNPYLYFQQHSSAPSAYHPPGLVSILLFANALGLHSATSQRVVMCLLGTGSIAVIGVLGRRLVNERVGIVAALIAAVYPNIWINDGMLMTETLYIFVIALALLFAYRALAKSSWGDVLACSACCTVAGLTRPEALLLLPMLVLPVVVGCRRLTPTGRLKLLGGAAAVAVVLLLPWTAFNYARFHKIIPTSTGSGPTLAVAYCDSTFNGSLFGYWDRTCIIPPKAQPATGNEVQIDNHWRKVAYRYLRGHVSALPRVVLAREGRMFGVFRVKQDVLFDAYVEGRGGGHGTAVVWWAQWMYWVLLPFGALGLVALRRRRIPLYPLLVQFALAAFVAGLTFGITRYRAGAEVALVVMAASGVELVIEEVSRRLPRRSARATAPVSVGERPADPVSAS